MTLNPLLVERGADYPTSRVDLINAQFLAKALDADIHLRQSNTVTRQSFIDALHEFNHINLVRPGAQFYTEHLDIMGHRTGRRGYIFAPHVGTLDKFGYGVDLAELRKELQLSLNKHTVHLKDRHHVIVLDKQHSIYQPTVNVNEDNQHITVLILLRDKRYHRNKLLSELQRTLNAHTPEIKKQKS